MPAPNKYKAPDPRAPRQHHSQAAPGPREQQAVPAGPELQEETEMCLEDKEDHQRERAKRKSKLRVWKGKHIKQVREEAVGYN